MTQLTLFAAGSGRPLESPISTPDACGDSFYTMARIRTLKPEFWTHPVMARLPADVQLLAIALLNHSDDYGYFRADPNVIRSACCPYAEDSDRVTKGLELLQNAEWIEVVHHPVQGFIGHVNKFDVHQRVYHPTPSPLRAYYFHESVVKNSRMIPENFGVHSDWKGRERKGKEGKTPDGVTSPHSNSPEDLMRKWNSLPKPIKQCQRISGGRAVHAKSRLADSWWQENLDAGLSKVAASSFLRGENTRRWIATIDWFLRPDSLGKVIEGTYDDPGSPTETTSDGIPFVN